MRAPLQIDRDRDNNSKVNAMKSMKWAIAFLLLATAGMGNVWADRGFGHGYGHGYGHFGVVIGPYWGPGYYGAPYPYYPPYSAYPAPYYPPVVVERADPPIYIEQPATLPEPEAVLPQPPGYWYYCSAAKGYYPYVRECPSGWQKVAPQPPAKP
jgi:hypothetical protein